MRDEDYLATREEELYHESARELARMIVELEDENRVLKRHIAWMDEHRPRVQCSTGVISGYDSPPERCALEEGHQGDCEI